MRPPVLLDTTSHRSFCAAASIVLSLRRTLVGAPSVSVPRLRASIRPGRAAAPPRDAIPPARLCVCATVPLSKASPDTGYHPHVHNTTTTKEMKQQMEAGVCTSVSDSPRGRALAPLAGGDGGGARACFGPPGDPGGNLGRSVPRVPRAWGTTRSAF